MTLGQYNPVASPEYIIDTDNNCLRGGNSSVTINKSDDLADLAHEFPWLKGVKLGNEGVSSAVDVSYNKVKVINSLVNTEPLGLVLPETRQLSRKSSNTVSGYEQGSNIQITVSEPTHVPEFSSSTPSHVQNHPHFFNPRTISGPSRLLTAHHGPNGSMPLDPLTLAAHHVVTPFQQTSSSYYNSSAHSCPPQNLTLPHGAHGATLHAPSSQHAPHGGQSAAPSWSPPAHSTRVAPALHTTQKVSPTQQTASYYYIPDSIYCPPQNAPFDQVHTTNMPLSSNTPVPSKNAHSQPPFFNPNSLGGPPMPIHAQHTRMGSRQQESRPTTQLPHAHGQILVSNTKSAEWSPRVNAQNSNFNLDTCACPRPHVSLQSNLHYNKEQSPVTHYFGPNIPLNAPLAKEFSSSEAQDQFVHNIQSSLAPLNLHNPEKSPSYAQVVCPIIHPPVVAAPTKKGDYFVVSMDDELYRRQVEKCKQSFIGKVSYAPGVKPHILPDLKTHLQKSWNTNGELRIAHLGKGYYNIRLDSPEDRKRVGARSSWSISTGTIRLSTWKPGFNPYKINSSISQVWLRIYELPFEFWHTSVISGIARVIGNPIKIDERSLDGSVGHYVRVLVEVDLALPMHMEAMVDGPDYCDLVHLHFENLPLYCPNCKLIGHSVTNCYKLKRNNDEHQHSASANTTTSKSPSRGRGRGRQRSRSRLVYRVVDKIKDTDSQKETTSLPTEVATSNFFEALAELDSFPDTNIDSEPVRQASGDKTHASVIDNTNLPQPSEASHSLQAEHMASSSAIIPCTQIAPKSILKKSRREVTGIAQSIAEVRSSDFITAQHPSWADRVEEIQENQRADAQVLPTENREEPPGLPETQSDFVFSRYTQDIVDQVRSKAGTNFRIQRPIAAANQAMRLMVTKNWSGENGTPVEPTKEHPAFSGDKILDNLPGEKIPNSHDHSSLEH